MQKKKKFNKLKIYYLVTFIDRSKSRHYYGRIVNLNQYIDICYHYHHIFCRETMIKIIARIYFKVFFLCKIGFYLILI